MKIFETQDGSHSIFSEKYGVPYHSKYGAIRETRHVFIEAGLRPKAIAQKKLSILEIGFGTGLNAFMTYHDAVEYDLNIHYVAVEKYPITLELAGQLNYPDLLNLEKYGQAFIKMHESDWGKAVEISLGFRLEKKCFLFEEIDFKSRFDVIYFDAFAPDAQPELWEAPVMERMFEALLPGGILVTYCAKGAVKRTLKKVGFEVEALKGPPGKREMTRARKPE